MKRSWVVCLALGFLLVAPHGKTAGTAADWPGPKISTDWLANHLDGSVIIVCTSSREQFAEAHIPGAVNLPDWKMLSEERNGSSSFVLSNKARAADVLKMKGITPQKPVIIYDDFENPWPQDGRLYVALRYYGFRQVGVLDGGIGKWKKENRTVEKGGVMGKMHDMSPNDIKFQDELLASKDWIRQHLGFGGIQTVDVRESEEFGGTKLYGEKRGGHIPGAVNIPWRSFFREDGTLRSEMEIKLLLSDKGVSGKNPVVPYCTGGVRSGIAFYVLEVIGYPARHYDGSWWEWSADPKLPAKTSE